MEDQDVFCRRRKGLLQMTKMSPLEDQIIFYGRPQRSSMDDKKVHSRWPKSRLKKAKRSSMKVKRTTLTDENIVRTRRKELLQIMKKYSLKGGIEDEKVFHRRRNDLL